MSEKKIGPEVKKKKYKYRIGNVWEMFEVWGRGEKMKYKILGVQKKSKLIFVKERCWGKIAFGKKNV